MIDLSDKSGIEGVEFKVLKTHHDERGFFREIVRIDDQFYSEFGQWSHCVMYQGVIKAWHFHRNQTDWWYVGNGVIRVALHDLREKSSSYRVTTDFLMGDNQKEIAVSIPPGVAHGCKVLQGPASLYYLTSHIYNPDDEGRLAHDDPEIGYDWLRPPSIS